jgi:Ca2+-binding RTX toxin-like protein
MSTIGYINGTNGNDNLFLPGASKPSAEHNWQITCLAGDDCAVGGSYSDTIIGGTGNDTLRGGSGGRDFEGDFIYGDEGFDSIIGSGFGDQLYGGAGSDTLIGGAGSDFMYGGDGDDVINGGDGSDTIFLGSGNDQVIGGANGQVIGGGADRFDFTQSQGSSYTLIYDIDPNETIVLKSNSKLYWRYYDTGAGNAGVQIGVDLANTSNDDSIFLKNRTDLSNINFIGAVSIQQI